MLNIFIEKLSLRHLLLLSCLQCTVVFATGETSIVSTRNSDGAILGDSTDGMASSISANGRYIAFHTFNPLDDADTNGGKYDIYLHDRLTKKNTLVSISSSGAIGNGNSFHPSISADGRFIAFSSDASNLVNGDTNNQSDIFVHDRVTKQTTRVSVHSNGNQAISNTWGFNFLTKPSLSADGRFVAFSSLADNLVDKDTNSSEDVFFHDRLTKQTSRISVNSAGIQGSHSTPPILYFINTYPSINADGRFVAFGSDFDNLVLNDTNNAPDIFVHDRKTAKTYRVSVNSSNVQGNFDSLEPSISANGRFVTFTSISDNLVTGDTNHNPDIFVHDRSTKETSRVSVDSSGKQAMFGGFLSDISADGRYVAFTSISTDLVSLYINNEGTFIHDRLNKQTTIVNINTDGNQGTNCCSSFNLRSYSPSLSADGRYVAFDSYLPLVASDFDNGFDIFVRDRLLDNHFQADLVITNTQKPVSLTINNVGNFQYTIKNTGLYNIGILRIQHLVSNGEVVSLMPSKGSCQRYTAISLCKLLDLSAGSSVTLTANIKALRNSVVQSLSISSGGRADPEPGNNYLTIKTPVTN